MSEHFRPARRVTVHREDIIARWDISVDRFMQRMIADIESFIDRKELTRVFLGKRWNRTVIHELVLQMFYQAMHINSKFDWESMDIHRFLEVTVNGYVQPCLRGTCDRKEDVWFSRNMDVICDSITLDLEDYIVEQGMDGRYYEPILTRHSGNRLQVEVYDQRAYLWMLEDQRRREDTDDEDDGY